MHRVNIHLTVLLSALVLAGRADAHNGDHPAYAIPIFLRMLPEIGEDCCKNWLCNNDFR